VDWLGAAALLHSLFQLRAHRERPFWLQHRFARDVHQPIQRRELPMDGVRRPGQDGLSSSEVDLEMELSVIIGGVFAALKRRARPSAPDRAAAVAFLRAHRDLRSWKRSEEARLDRRIAEYEEEAIEGWAPHGQKRETSNRRRQ